MNIRSAIFGTTALVVLLTAGAAQSLSGSNTVFSDDIVDGTITHGDIKANSIGGSRFLDNSVTGGKILNNTVTGADLNEETMALPGVIKTTAIRSDGTKLFGAGTTSRPNPGEYLVDYGFSLNNCTAQATVGSQYTQAPESVTTRPATPLVFPGYPSANRVGVFIYDSAGTGASLNVPLFVTVTCAAGSGGHSTAAAQTSSRKIPPSPVSP